MEREEEQYSRNRTYNNKKESIQASCTCKLAAAHNPRWRNSRREVAVMEVDQPIMILTIESNSPRPTVANPVVVLHHSKTR